MKRHHIMDSNTTCEEDSNAICEEYSNTICEKDSNTCEEYSKQHVNRIRIQHVKGNYGYAEDTSVEIHEVRLFNDCYIFPNAVCETYVMIQTGVVYSGGSSDD